MMSMIYHYNVIFSSTIHTNHSNRLLTSSVKQQMIQIQLRLNKRYIV